MKTKRMKDGGLNLDDARLKVPREVDTGDAQPVEASFGGEGGGEDGSPPRVRAWMGGGGSGPGGRKAFGRIGVSRPIGKDSEVEAYAQGYVDSKGYSGRDNRVGVDFVKRFARGGLVKGPYSK